MTFMRVVLSLLEMSKIEKWIEESRHCQERRADDGEKRERERQQRADESDAERREQESQQRESLHHVQEHRKHQRVRRNRVRDAVKERRQAADHEQEKHTIGQRQIAQLIRSGRAGVESL